MKIAVAGGTGFIGQALVKALLAQGNIRPIDKSVRPSYHQTAPKDDSGCRYEGVDLRDPDQCEYLVFGMDVVYHCAGVTTGSGAAGAGGRNLVGDNVRIALSMFAACAKAGVKKLICMSSTTGYPDRPLLKEEEFFEGEVYPAYRHVGEAMRFKERIAAMYPELETTFIRCAGTYGPGADFDPATSHVIEATIRKVAEGQNPLVVWGDGEDVRDAAYIDDLVRALMLAGTAPPGAYNIASGRAMSVNEMLKTLIWHAGYDPEVTAIQHDLSKPKMIRSRLLDISKARSVLGWQPTVPMAEGLVKTYDWYRSTPWLT